MLKQNRIKIIVTLSENVVERIRTMAENEDMPLSRYVSDILREYLAERDQNPPDSSH